MFETPDVVLEIASRRQYCTLASRHQRNQPTLAKASIG
jgi:hypothetical protein